MVASTLRHADAEEPTRSGDAATYGRAEDPLGLLPTTYHEDDVDEVVPLLSSATSQPQQHREKLGASTLPHMACVARPVRAAKRSFRYSGRKNADFGSADTVLKGRAVFQRNNVRDHRGGWAIFQKRGSCPSIVEAARYADAYGLFPGNTVQ